jgi:glycosyltransferase involved in cell wall biosynthesis
LVPPGDPANLADALGRLLRDSGLRAQMGAEGARRAERYDLAEVASRFLEQVGRVTGSRPSSR